MRLLTCFVLGMGMCLFGSSCDDGKSSRSKGSDEDDDKDEDEDEDEDDDDEDDDDEDEDEDEDDEESSSASSEETPEAEEAALPKLDRTTGCPDGTHEYSFWSGEYPGPPVQVDGRTPIRARADPCDLKASTKCVLQPGLYHPWMEDDPAKGYVTIAPVSRYRLLKAQSMDGTPLPAGTEITELAYLSEGYCLMEINGEETQGACVGMWEDEAYEQLAHAASGLPARQFFGIDCKGTTAWVEVDEKLFEAADIQTGQIIGWGEVGPAGGSPDGGI